MLHAAACIESVGIAGHGGVEGIADRGIELAFATLQHLQLADLAHQVQADDRHQQDRRHPPGLEAHGARGRRRVGTLQQVDRCRRRQLLREQSQGSAGEQLDLDAVEAGTRGFDLRGMPLPLRRARVQNEAARAAR